MTIATGPAACSEVLIGRFSVIVAPDVDKRPLSSTVVGSYPQPEWLIDRAALGSHSVPRVRMSQAWRIPEPYLEEAQDDATVVAIRDMERAGIDTITDGEIRRESYSNRFATALDGIDSDNPATIHTSGGEPRTVPRIVGPIRWRGPVEVPDIEFLRSHTDRATKITLPGPFTMAQQASNEAYDDPDELVMDLAAAVNQEAHALQSAGADVIQLDEPWLRNDPDGARRIAVAAIDRALAGLSVTTAVHLCFGYAALVRRQEPEPVRLPGRAERQRRAADLDRSRAAWARSRPAVRAQPQDRRARRARPRRRPGRDPRAGCRSDPRGARPRPRRAARPGP